MALRSLQALQRRSLPQLSALLLCVANGESSKTKVHNFNVILPWFILWQRERHENNDADFHELHFVWINNTNLSVQHKNNLVNSFVPRGISWELYELNFVVGTVNAWWRQKVGGSLKFISPGKNSKALEKLSKFAKFYLTAKFCGRSTSAIRFKLKISQKFTSSSRTKRPEIPRKFIPT